MPDPAAPYRPVPCSFPSQEVDEAALNFDDASDSEEGDEEDAEPEEVGRRARAMGH